MLSKGVIPELPKPEEGVLGMHQKEDGAAVKKPEKLHEPVLVDSKEVKPNWKSLPAVTVGKAEVANEECAFAAAPNGNTADVQVLCEKSGICIGTWHFGPCIHHASWSGSLAARQ